MAKGPKVEGGGGGELRARGRIALKSGCCDPDRL